MKYINQSKLKKSHNVFLKKANRFITLTLSSLIGLNIINTIGFANKFYANDLKTDEYNYNNDEVNINDNEYILGAGDSIYLELDDLPDQSRRLKIERDNTIALPIIGITKIKGLTIKQAERYFISLYSKELLRPNLRIRLTESRPIQIALIGEIERPGVYTLSNNESSTVKGLNDSIIGSPDLIAALKKAGGVTLNADLRSVLLKRKLPGKETSYKQTKLNLLALLRDGDLKQNQRLFDGDVIQISKAELIDQGSSSTDFFELANANFSPQTINVNLIGEVKSPGRRSLPSNTPLIQAVLAAGGPINWRANKGNIELIRINKNGSVNRQRFALNLNQGASNTKNPSLRNGDTVIIPRSGIAAAGDAMDAITKPLRGVVNLWAIVELATD